MVWEAEHIRDGMTIALRLWRLTNPSRGTHSRHHCLPNDISCVMQGSQPSLEYSLCHPDHISCVIQGSQLSPEYSLCHPNHKSCVMQGSQPSSEYSLPSSYSISCVMQGSQLTEDKWTNLPSLPLQVDHARLTAKSWILMLHPHHIHCVMQGSQPGSNYSPD